MWPEVQCLGSRCSRCDNPWGTVVDTRGSRPTEDGSVMEYVVPRHPRGRCKVPKGSKAAIATAKAVGVEQLWTLLPWPCINVFDCCGCVWSQHGWYDLSVRPRADEGYQGNLVFIIVKGLSRLTHLLEIDTRRSRLGRWLPLITLLLLLLPGKVKVQAAGKESPVDGREIIWISSWPWSVFLLFKFTPSLYMCFADSEFGDMIGSPDIFWGRYCRGTGRGGPIAGSTVLRHLV